MKKPAILLASILLVSLAWAQNISDKKELLPGSVDANSATTTIDLPFFTSSSNAEKIVVRIMDAVGMECNFKIKMAKVPNVEAVIRHHERYILYNPDFVSQVNSVTKNKWAGIFILAHEIAHHLEGHTGGRVTSRPDSELRADEFAGSVLWKMGATLRHAQLVLFYISDIQASKTHPGRADRLSAIEKGWLNARAQMPGQSDTESDIFISQN